MAKYWEYAKATKWIAEHGGTQKALETVKSYYMKKGFREGAASKNPVIAFACAGGLVTGFAGKCIYDKIMKKKASEANTEFVERAKVKKAEAELVAAMEQAPQVETETLGKTAENSPKPIVESTSMVLGGN